MWKRLRTLRERDTCEKDEDMVTNLVHIIVAHKKVVLVTLTRLLLEYLA